MRKPSNPPDRDPFARIADMEDEDRRAGLSEPCPVPVPRRTLPLGRTARKFRPRRRLETDAALARELARVRRVHAPFLRNLAPPLPTERPRLQLEHFDWRPETVSDRGDFPSVLAGRGAWEQITIPHFGGPLGRAVTYYRTKFTLTSTMLVSGSLFVRFGGVDYAAQVFVNGAFVGSHEGFFAPFECDITAVAKSGDNVLVVKVGNDAAPISGNGSWGMKQDGDKLYGATGPGWDDPELGWHHCPPGMGIYQTVTVEARPRLHLTDVFVRPLLDEQRAEVWIEVFNCDLAERPVQFTISVFGQNFSRTVFRDRAYQPPQQAGPRLNCFRFAFDMPHAKVWQPDTPWLYQIQVALADGDALIRQFGMRSFIMDTAGEPRGRLLLNGREIRLRGANTMGFEQQDVIRGDLAQLRDDILLAKICHMNFWRLTQRPVQPEVYEMCDRLGLMTQTDLPLFGFLPRRQFCEAVRQAEEMERLVRNHPCNVVISYINEPFPETWHDKTHRQCTRVELHAFFAAADRAVHLANPDRVIKPVDGDYDPPAPGLPDNHCYTCWYNGHGVELGKLHQGHWQKLKPGWFYGCGEFGAEGLDPVGLMRRRYPKAWLPQSARDEATWSPTSITDAQTGKFHYLFFDTQRTLAGWVDASQRHQAWATRFMTEAFRRDRRMVSMAIHLFIDAWPAGWMKAIMDVERRAKPAFFAYREALTPLLANLRSDRYTFIAGEEIALEAWICNDTDATHAGAILAYRLEVGGQVVESGQARARIPRCSSLCQGRIRFTAPQVVKRCAGVARLAILDAQGRVLHDCDLELELFPRRPVPRHRSRVTVVGALAGKAARFVRELGCVAGTADAGLAELIVIDDPALFILHRAAIEAAVSDGATALILELPAGEYDIAGTAIVVEACGMGARQFVSRDTGHALVAGFLSEDFRLWYDPALGRISPLLETCFRAPGWTRVLTTGNGGCAGGWGPALVAAERIQGRGRWLISNLRLAGRLTTNPVAACFGRRLLGQDDGDGPTP